MADPPGVTVQCRHCGLDWPARMQSCPGCLAELRTDPDAAAEAMGAVLAAGGHLFRAPGVAPFASGPDCDLVRLSPRGGLRFIDSSGLVEASVEGRGIDAVPPLACEDFDGSPLFRLVRYEAASRAVVAIGRGDAPIATYLRTERGIDVRDETSAPVARLSPTGTGDWSLIETGGEALATCCVHDEQQESWVDDQWSFRQVAPRLPLQVLAAVGLMLAAKVLLGRPRPVSAREYAPEDYCDDGVGPDW